MKIYTCTKCHFKTREKNKICPICNHEMDKGTLGEINYNPTLPQIIEESNRPVKIYYYCTKCQKEMKTSVCIECNNVGSLCIEYNNKRAFINRINSLIEVFKPNEVDEISTLLTEQEKYWLYYNYEDAYSFFYKTDKTKAIACFIMGVIMFALCFLLGANYVVEEMEFVSYIALAVGYGCLFIFFTLGIWYLIDASNIEYKGIQVPILVVTCISMVSFMLIALIMELSFVKQLIFGFICMLFAIILYLIYLYVKRKRK